ncbi:hypothetical protein QQP08_005075 [Theobroma cacao]|nr:hypothetical protein QQP08_005075 [Theobroma cacao]
MHGKGGVVTVFVNNVPPQVGWRELGSVCQRYGEVLDAFIPFKRSRWGRKIGFGARDAYWKEKITRVQENKVESKRRGIGNIGKNVERKSEYVEKSYIQALLEGKRKETDGKISETKGMSSKIVCKGFIEEERMQWLRPIMIETCKSQSKPETITEHMRMERVYGIEVKRCSGNQFVISFWDKDFFEAMQGSRWTWLEE